MRVDRQKRNNFTYRQTVYIILIFYLVYRGKCNSTDTNNSTSTSDSIVSDTSVYSTPNLPSTFFTTLDTSTGSQISTASNTISSTTNTLDASSITTLNTSTNTTSYTASTLTALSSTHTNSPILSNNATLYTTSLDNTTTDITSSESLINASTIHNTTYSHVTSIAVNCTVAANETNNSSSKNCQQDIGTICVKSTTLTAEEGKNITIQGNSTWNCPNVVWYRHYNWSTHGHHIYPNRRYQTPTYRHKILTSHPICHPDVSSPAVYHDLCRSCNKTELRIYDLNTTNSGRYSRRCYKEYNHDGPHEDENFGLTVNPRNDTDNHTTPLCPRYVGTQSEEDEEDDDYTLSTITNNNMRKTSHRDISHGTRTTWALTLICIACILLFFVRRALNKRYRPLRDDISESNFVVRYHPEHED